MKGGTEGGIFSDTKSRDINPSDYRITAPSFKLKKMSH